MAIKKVWISEHTPCTVCHLCEDIAPEVFTVDNKTSHIKEKANFKKNDKAIKDAALACPVEIIKFE